MSMPPRAALAAILVVIVSGFSACRAGARTIAVPGNAPTIKGAMLKAGAGDIILVSCGTYREHDIQVKPGVSLWSGTLRPDCVTIDADGRGRIFIFTGADTSTAVVGFTLRGGKVVGEGEHGRGGAILCLDSSPRIANCVIQDNEASSGGGLFADASSAPRVIACKFLDNRAEGSGGGVQWLARGGYLLKCRLEGNTALTGGGMASAGPGRLDVRHTLIAGNSAGNCGGGIFHDGAGGLIRGSLLVANEGGLTGGALACLGTGLRLANCTVDASASDRDGAALACRDAAPKLVDCIIAHRTGALLETSNATPSLRGCDLFLAGSGSWPSALREQAGRSQNLAADPLFCNPAGGDYHLRSGSPCLPAHNPTGNSGLVGALGEGCGAPFPDSVVD